MQAAAAAGRLDDCGHGSVLYAGHGAGLRMERSMGVPLCMRQMLQWLYVVLHRLTAPVPCVRGSLSCGGL
jgi:hypothetical protein